MLHEVFQNVGLVALIVAIVAALARFAFWVIAVNKAVRQVNGLNQMHDCMMKEVEKKIEASKFGIFNVLATHTRRIEALERPGKEKSFNEQFDK